eukprot:g27775.t1
MRCCSSSLWVIGVIVTLEEGQDGHVTQGVGRGVKMIGDQKVLLFVANRVQALYKTVSKPLLGFTDVEDVCRWCHCDTGGGCAAEELGVGDHILAG